MGDTTSTPSGYDYVRHISEGGFGTVIEVSENLTGEHFAVKMMRCISETDKERIRREVHRLQTFVHPHIVGLKEVGAMENAQAIVMELGGPSLAQLVKSHSERGVLIDRHIVYQVMVDISSALCFMHNHPKERTAHGDVKLENILQFGEYHAKLCDLGAAESEDVSSTRGVMSMQYVSPERLEDPTGRASGSGDVWALGIVLHFLLFGKSPFRSTHAAGLIREIVSFKPKQIGKSCGEKERKLLMRMLDPDCGSRLTSTQLVESSILRRLINTTEAGWKLSEMKSKETEKRVGELTKEKQTLQDQLKKEQKGREESTRERLQLMKTIEDMEAQMRTAQIDGKHLVIQEQDPERVVKRRTGTFAIEWLPAIGFSLSGSVFTRIGGPHPNLVSMSFEKVVFRISFTIGRLTDSARFGIVASSQTDKVKEGSNFTSLLGGAGWDVFDRYRDAVQNYKYHSKGFACAAAKRGQRVVLEADGRDGKRSLKLSQDGETQPVFFSNIPVPFRFAISLIGNDDSDELKSLILLCVVSGCDVTMAAEAERVTCSIVVPVISTDAPSCLIRGSSRVNELSFEDERTSYHVPLITNNIGDVWVAVGVIDPPQTRF
ncbi:putative CBL-interacting protein kinase 17 [Blattamonas nauphoetae]|uniref:non-specific serine/threonine protein kinase n=1 Tax=Blattamonas nauphoetae TaxID=2049346 RepID=A0ABQ9WUK2_9EUKA|nr:putative CBL-interacting protein kinase 17 [Blattamonas nauphoetae]